MIDISSVNTGWSYSLSHYGYLFDNLPKEIRDLYNDYDILVVNATINSFKRENKFQVSFDELEEKIKENAKDSQDRYLQHIEIDIETHKEIKSIYDTLNEIGV